MSSWFDDIEQQPPASAEDGERFSEEGEEQPPKRAPKRARGGAVTIDRNTVVLVGAFALAVGIVVATLWYLSTASASSDAAADGGEDTTAAQAAEEGDEETASVEAASNPDEQVAVAGQCEPEDDETTLSTADTSLRGVVAQWQEKYYDRDTSLTDHLTESSWLRDQDWEQILAEGAPDGSSWCAVMGPVEDDHVDVDVMVTYADNSSQVFKQTVTGAQDADGTWLIDDIEIR